MEGFFDQIVWWVGLVVIFGLCLAAFGYWWRTNEEGQRRRFGGYLEAAGVVSALVGMWFIKPDSYAIPEITIPSETDEVDVCTEVTVSGDPPRGNSLVVAAEEHGGNRIEFESDIYRSGDSWNALIHFGNPENDPRESEGSHFNVYSVLLDEELARLLKDTNDTGGGSWSSRAWPPGADVGEPVEVIGSGEMGACP